MEKKRKFQPMKKLLYLLFLSGLFTGCVTDEPAGPVPGELKTDDNILLTHYTTIPVPEPGEFSFLGYGYDVTGEYADASAVKSKVFDMVKLDALYPDDLLETRVNSIKGGPEIASSNIEDFLKSISGKINSTQGLSLFKGTVTSYFPDADALSDKYILARYAYTKTSSNLRFMSPRWDCLSDEFKSDIQGASPKDLVEKYGTHFLSSVFFGHHLIIMYQAETEHIDREKAAKLGLTVAMKKIFRLWTGDIDHMEEMSATGNFSQKLSYKVAGGDPSLISPTILLEENYPRVQIHEWEKSCSEENEAFIDMQLRPLYDVIQDSVKKEEMKIYIEKYLKENEFKL